MNKIYQVYQVSDSTGETLDRIFLAIKSQFSDFECKTIHYSFTRTKNQADKIISKCNEEEINYATGGRHLLSQDLIMDPTEYKNRNQYMAMARQELYNRKRETDEKILNPSNIPPSDLETLGKIIDQDTKLRKKLQNKYLSEDEHYKVRMQITRLQGEKMLLIKDIKNKEKLYSRTVKEGEGKRAFKQNDENYIAFRQQQPTSYVNARGTKMQIPQGIGGKF